MRAVVFLVYLCFFLPGKNDCVAAMQRHSAGYTQTHFIAKSQQPESIGTDHTFIAEDIDTANEKEYLIGDEVEDEDTDNCFVKKNKLLELYYFAFSHLFFSDHSCKLFNALSSFQGQSSPKYITQRVLRI